MIIRYILSLNYKMDNKSQIYPLEIVLENGNIIREEVGVRCESLEHAKSLEYPCEGEGYNLVTIIGTLFPGAVRYRVIDKPSSIQLVKTVIDCSHLKDK